MARRLGIWIRRFFRGTLSKFGDLYRWTIWGPSSVGAGLLIAAYVATSRGSMLHEFLCALGSLLFTIGIVGVLLNAVWWRSWAIRTIAELFSDRSLIEKLHLSEKELRDRFHAMIGAAYGSNLPSARFREAFDRDVLTRLEYPVRREFEMSYDLKAEYFDGDHAKGDLARLNRVVRYRLHNYSKGPAKPYTEARIFKGFVDVPELVRLEWCARLAGQSVDSDEARKVLKDIDKKFTLFDFGRLSINGERLVLDRDFTINLKYDGAKREPDVTYEVLLSEDAMSRYSLGENEELHVVISHSDLHDLHSYDFTMMSQPTEGAIIHFCWEKTRFCGVMRYVLPPYWTDKERELVEAGSSHTVLFVNSLLLPGHAALVTWSPKPDAASERAAEGDETAAAPSTESDEKPELKD